jgi:hypothetical protein
MDSEVAYADFLVMECSFLVVSYWRRSKYRSKHRMYVVSGHDIQKGAGYEIPFAFLLRL